MYRLLHYLYLYKELPMKRNKKRFVFIGKSLLWSLLFYIAMMVAVNWDEIRNTATGKNDITVVNNTLPGTQSIPVNDPEKTHPGIADHLSAVRVFIAIAKVLISTTSKSD